MDRIGTTTAANRESEDNKQHSYFNAPVTRLKAEIEKLLALFSMVGRLLW